MSGSNKKNQENRAKGRPVPFDEVAKRLLETPPKPRKKKKKKRKE